MQGVLYSKAKGEQPVITQFKCPEKEAEGLYLSNGSKFISFVKQVASVDEAKEFISSLRKKHPFASHICYAYSILENLGRTLKSRSSDDKEPSGTAGKPILECLKNNDLNNTIICVVRYFGGTLLGASNLLRAYVTASQKAIDEASLVTKKLSTKFEIGVGYNELSKVETFLNNKNCRVLDTEFAEDIYLTVAVPSEFESFKEEIQNLLGHNVDITKLSEEFV